MKGPNAVRIVALLAFVLAGASPAFADGAGTPPGAPPTPEERAGEVIRAHAAGAAETVSALAAEVDPDAWLVADALLAKGAQDAAAAFAKAAPPTDVGRLAEFVGEPSGGEAAASARERLAKGNAALVAGRPADALAAFEDPPAGVPRYLAARLAYGHALALGALERHAEAADRFRASREIAASIGWRRRVADALRSLAKEEMAAQRHAKAEEALLALVDLESERKRPTIALASSQELLGQFFQERGSLDRAAEADAQALATYRALDEKPAIARVLNHAAWTELRRGRVDEAARLAEQAAEVAEAAGLPGDAVRARLTASAARRRQGRFDQALVAQEKGLATARKAGDRNAEAVLLYWKGRSLADRAEHERAAEPFTAAAKAFEEAGAERPDAAAIARAFAGIAWVYAGRLEEARAEASKVAARAKTPGASPVVEAMSQWLAGSILQREEKGEEAATALAAAAGRLEGAREYPDSLLVIVQLGELQRLRKELPDAKRAAQHVRDGAKKLGNPYHGALGTTLAARVAMDEGDTKTALALANEALAAFRTMHVERGVAALSTLVKQLEAAPR
jgi:hypothetical protein